MRCHVSHCLLPAVGTVSAAAGSRVERRPTREKGRERLASVHRRRRILLRHSLELHVCFRWRRRLRGRRWRMRGVWRVWRVRGLWRVRWMWGLWWVRGMRWVWGLG